MALTIRGSGSTVYWSSSGTPCSEIHARPRIVYRSSGCSMR